MKPTQAQIEAAAKIICDRTSNMPMDYSRSVAKAALTAAAEVEGEAMPQLIAQAERNRDNLTIERCAQTAENMNVAGIQIAAAIRAIKDE